MSVADYPLIWPLDIDRRLSLRPGTAEKLAKRGLLPHVKLPDGQVRFVWSEVESALDRVPAAKAEVPRAN